MAAPQSLKQLIAVNAADLVVVQNQLSTLTTGDVDLTARIDTNATLIAANQASLTTLTATAGVTASALANATSGFTGDISAVNGRIDAEVVRATAAEDAAIAGAVVEIAAGEARSAALVVVERVRAVAAEVALGIRVDGEATARGAAINAETNARLGAFDNEITARAAGDAKMCFAHVMEFDGELAVGAYPFSHGAGVPSAAGFGVQIPMDYRLVGYGIECKTANVLDFVAAVEGYKIGESVVDWSKDIIVGSGRAFSSNSTDALVRSGGNVCLKIKSINAQAVVDAGDRFRVTLYFQSAVGFTSQIL